MPTEESSQKRNAWGRVTSDYKDKYVGRFRTKQGKIVDVW